MADSDIFGDKERLQLASTKVPDTLLRIQSYDSAREGYNKIITDILGPDFEVPISSDGGVVCPRYAALNYAQKADLMSCFVGLSHCALKVANMEEAMLWVEEAQLVYLNSRWSANPKIYDWTPWFPEDIPFAVQFARARAAAGDLFLSMTNTGTAVHRRYAAQTMIPRSVTAKERGIQRTILSTGSTSVLLQFRHPDPTLIQNQVITEPSLQVLGSWKKLKIKKAEAAPGRRMNISGFIWDGHLYIAGGRKDSLGPFYRDIFSLNLRTLDGWKALPEYPQPMSRTSAFLGWTMHPHHGHRKAYLFTGRPTVDFFDLQTKTWGSIQTKFHHAGHSDTDAGISSSGNPWPYPKSQAMDSTQQLVGDKLFVFGGTHNKTSIGCNLFVVLDLRTKVWKRLSGSVMPPKDSDPLLPGPRKTPSSWIDNEGDRFYLLFGECDRMGAMYSGEPHGGDHGHGYDDFWSWSFADAKWRRERWVGNVPCPRSEAACVYNPKINKTITWGGYNPNLPTDYHDQGMNFSFSYYADTFIYDGPPSSASLQNAPRRKWRQVITTSFPTYRAQGVLFVDPESGRTFLFGGYTNNDYVPSRKTAISRSFGDLWELRIDVSDDGSTSQDGRNAIDFEAERRTARMGPWQRCFACGSAGEGRKCGGSCGGKTFFCDQDCLKEGWKEHKTVHECQKVG